jgi:aminoglycoside/choline kinase family phosphotransferase
MTQLSGEAQKQFQPFVTRALKNDNFEIFQLAGDASARRYYRVSAQDPHGSSESWVLMVWDPFKNDGNYPFLSVLEHFAKHGVQVPAVKDLSPDEGLVLLEDLGDLTLERKFWENQSQKMSVPFYKLSLDELIKMHYPSTFDRGNCTAFKMEFDVEKLLWEMNYGREHLLTKLCKIEIPEKQKQEIDRIFTRICTILHEEPKFIAHRDYHSRNIMLKLGRARIIDFQDARLGSIQYDLVSLLRDSYVNMEDDMARELITYYLEQRREFAKGLGSRHSLEDPSLDHFNYIFEIQTIQRCFKACGSFASFKNLRDDTRYLKYLAPTLQRVKTSLSRFPEFKPFQDVLNDNGLFERVF